MPNKARCSIRATLLSNLYNLNMMVHFIKPASILLCTLLSVIPATPIEAVEAATIPQDYTAVYQVLHNDKGLAEVTIRLSHQDEVWTLHGFTHDMRGLADVLNVKGTQTATGTWQDGRFLPDDYRFSFSVIGYNLKWRANFDWPAGIVTTHSKSGETQLSLADGAVDPFSLSLNIGSHLSSRQTSMAVNIIDEDEIDKQMYEADREEPVDTALGCFQTTRVKRVHKNAKRVSMVWYANDYNYVPVLMLHSKKNGHDFKLKIKSLDVDGQMVHPTIPCGGENPVSRQAGLG